VTTPDIREALDPCARSTEQEIADEAAFMKLVVDPIKWVWTTPEPERTKIIGNARRAWHEALCWERTRRADNEV